MSGKPKEACTEEGRVVQYNAIKVRFHPEEAQAVLQAQLQALAKEIASSLSTLDPSQSKELLGSFVSELFLSAAEGHRREERRQEQAEGIAAAKARGVQFGPSRKPLPDNFYQYYEAWRNGSMTLTQAAERCGMSRATFHRAIARMEQAEDCAV